MKTTADFMKRKQTNEPITMVTAYDAPSAKLAESAGLDAILVGDSLGMVVLGYTSTIPVTVDDMVLHTKAVRRGAPNTFVVADLPHLSYHGSFDATLSNVRRLVQEAGADAVKLEGGATVCSEIKALTEAGVPVMGHIGLTPQSVAVMGGYKVQGKDRESARKLIEEAKAVEKAGAFSLVIECVPAELGKLISEQVTIPVIGIGAGVDTDGQVLVYHDLIGYGDVHVPKFVKAYTNVSEQIQQALESYHDEVKRRQFPTEAHSFTVKEDVLQGLYGGKIDEDN
ncbi:3-methyl-2-oxobutanoate hydroxymethyltransferase [Alkalicoccobacillus murimartini]|uniref:3-methyl-2-oxobutanoate hydroxymethyltransferase n=1 Tax=Alkalicoccobacillus murimartini TaxID=171685 RepID=A0ABT9YFV8_9BACI|nr:3-methyl-2-oxobutanoate hydroxymethyltransferase [Alkalicoccobacillus murimartini]MDQ0205949.1 3-methyl-2-oxobutanoate hydroxymethyltransferase [Alkalicoccobacillus murimartini]